MKIDYYIKTAKIENHRYISTMCIHRKDKKKHGRHWPITIVTCNEPQESEDKE